MCQKTAANDDAKLTSHGRIRYDYLLAHNPRGRLASMHSHIFYKAGQPGEFLGNLWGQHVGATPSPYLKNFPLDQVLDGPPHRYPADSKPRQQ